MGLKGWTDPLTIAVDAALMLDDDGDVFGNWELDVALDGTGASGHPLDGQPTRSGDPFDEEPW